MSSRKRIVLVAHDNCKQDLVDWVGWNHRLLSEHTLLATGTTGTLIEKAVSEWVPQGSVIGVQKLASSPLGGDQQLRAFITMDHHGAGRPDGLFLGFGGAASARRRRQGAPAYLCPITSPSPVTERAQTF